VRFISSENSGTAEVIRRDRFTIILNSAGICDSEQHCYCSKQPLQNIHTCSFPTRDDTDNRHQFHQIIQMKFTKALHANAFGELKNVPVSLGAILLIKTHPRASRGY